MPAAWPGEGVALKKSGVKKVFRLKKKRLGWVQRAW